MTIEMLQTVLLWCSVINLALLTWWWLFFWLAHDFVYRVHTRWFQLTVEKFDAIHYAGMAVFKLFVLGCNVTPYLALWIAAG